VWLFQKMYGGHGPENIQSARGTVDSHVCSLSKCAESTDEPCLGSDKTDTLESAEFGEVCLPCLMKSGHFNDGNHRHKGNSCDHGMLNTQTHAYSCDQLHNGVVSVVCRTCNDPAPQCCARCDGKEVVSMEAVKPRSDTCCSASDSTTLFVEGICCPSEKRVVEGILYKLHSVSGVSVNVTAKTITVLHDSKICSAQELASALNKASLGARVMHSTSDDGMPIVSTAGCNWHLSLIRLSATCWCVSLLSLVDPHGKTWLHNLQYAAVGATLIGLPPIALKACGALRLRVLDINSLMVIAACGAIFIGEYLESAAVVVLFSLSEWLEDKATSKVRNALTALLEMKPETAMSETTGKTVPIDSVQIGDCLSVAVGAKVPVDGEVVDGKSSTDESMLTGEARPVPKQIGSKVAAGCINVGGGHLVIKASAVAKDSAVAQIVELVKEAHACRSATEKRVEQFAKFYTPLVVGAALLMALTPWAFVDRKSALQWVHAALVLVVIACPCALVISTPITYVSTLAAAATHQVLIRGGEYLEELGSIAGICFDKTGTLTEGRFGVSSFFGTSDDFSGEISRVDLLGWVASVEQKSTHPIATALVAYAQNSGAIMNLQAVEFIEHAGLGVEAIVEGKHVRVGSQLFVTSWKPCGDENETDVDSNERPVEAWAQIKKHKEFGHTVCYVGVDGHVAAIFSVTDAVRLEAFEAVATLQKLGVEPIILTGDCYSTAEAVASAVGIKTCRAELLPQDKVSVVSELQARKCLEPAAQQCCRRSTGGTSVAMVGDGINDAAALAAANVGIAMGEKGTHVAIENAQVVLMDSDLRKLVLCVRLGRLAVKKIKQNIAFALVSKFMMVAMAIAGQACLWQAILADLGSMLVVTLNASSVLAESYSKKAKNREMALP